MVGRDSVDLVLVSGQLVVWEGLVIEEVRDSVVKMVPFREGHPGSGLTH